MAGYTKEEALRVLREKLTVQIEADRKSYGRALENFDQRKISRENSRTKLEQILTDAYDAIKRGRYEDISDILMADNTLGYAGIAGLATLCRGEEMEPSADSTNRANIAYAIKLVENYSDDTIGINDLRALGILPFLKI